jgi:EpsI family protein
LLKFLNSVPVRVATLFMILQAAILYSSVRPESKVPASRPLSEFPTVLGPWTQFGPDGVVDEETRTVLNADDLLDRNYVNSATRRGAFFFVAAFRTQRNGKAPHSPKNCLPGSGWTQESADDKYPVDVGAAQPILVNRYLVAHGNDRSVVLYWYQSRDRVVANEFKAKFWVMADAIHLNRTDTALVKVVVSIGDNQTAEDADRTAVDFVKAFFGPLHQFLPA